MAKILIAIILFLSFSALTLAHSGRTDADGCHTNKKTRGIIATGAARVGPLLVGKVISPRFLIPLRFT